MNTRDNRFYREPPGEGAPMPKPDNQQDLLALQRRTSEALERIADLLATLLEEMRRSPND
jgi:hypothetical protein